MKEDWKEELQYEDAKVALINVWKWKKVILLCGIIGLVLGALFLSIKNRATVYTAKASVYNIGYETNFQTTSASTVMQRYSNVIMSRKLCERGAAMLNKQGLTYWHIQRMLSTSYDEQSGILAIYAANSYDPALTVEVVNVMTQVFCEEANTVIGGDIFKVLDTANSFSTSKQYSVKKYLVIFAFGMLALSMVVIFFVTFFSGRARSVKQCLGEEEKMLGMIPDLGESESRKTEGKETEKNK